MKYLQQIILFLLTRINLDYKNFNCFYDSLEDETIEIIESMNHHYLSGLLNYYYGHNIYMYNCLFAWLINHK